MWGGQLFWNSNRILAVVSVVFVLIFIFGSIENANFEEYAPLPHGSSSSSSDMWFAGGMPGFLRSLSVCCWVFVTIEFNNLACQDVQDPKRSIPISYVWCVSVYIILVLAVVILCVSQAPGTQGLSTATFALNPGFINMFGISDSAATWFSIPLMLGSAQAGVFYYGRQLRSMGKSGLINPIFGYELPGRNTPAVALITGSALGFGAACLSYYYDSANGSVLAQLGVLAALVSYMFQLVAFCRFRYAFHSVRKEFINPLGVAGAVFSFVVFLLCFISLVVFETNWGAIGMLFGFAAVGSAYYFAVVRHRQYFSTEEQKILFCVHVVKSKFSLCFDCTDFVTFNYILACTLNI